MTRRVDNFSIYAKLFKTETFQFEETKVEALLYVFILKNPKDTLDFSESLIHTVKRD